uniref:Uncharacterized protein n=1 Tax=Anguilla anguilla TaxID=7936 RepID=A0A0E9Q448_ANGAN
MLCQLTLDGRSLASSDIVLFNFDPAGEWSLTETPPAIWLGGMRCV